MNELVIVKTKEAINNYISYKPINRKRIKYRTKTIQLYINDLLNPERYMLNIFNSKYIEIYIIKNSYRSFFGIINRNRNKKNIYELIESHIRIKDE